MGCSRQASFLRPPKRTSRLDALSRAVDGGTGKRGQSCSENAWRDTNLKLGDVVSDMMGKASRLILHAIVDGETDPATLAEVALGKVHADRGQLMAALTGHVDDHHRFLLREHLTQIEHLEKAVDRVTKEIARRFTLPPPPEEADVVQQQPASLEEALDPTSAESSSPKPPTSWADAMMVLCSIAGISERAAFAILAAIGINMQQFPTAGHLASWAGVCPGNQ